MSTTNPNIAPHVLEEGIGSLQDGLAANLRQTGRRVLNKANNVFAEILDTVRDLTADKPVVSIGVAATLGYASVKWVSEK